MPRTGRTLQAIAKPGRDRELPAPTAIPAHLASLVTCLPLGEPDGTDEEAGDRGCRWAGITGEQGSQGPSHSPSVCVHRNTTSITRSSTVRGSTSTIVGSANEFAVMWMRTEKGGSGTSIVMKPAASSGPETTLWSAT
jgi:hypothetical protein